MKGEGGEEPLQDRSKGGARRGLGLRERRDSGTLIKEEAERHSSRCG